MVALYEIVSCLQDISDMRLEVEGEEVGGQILPHFYCEDMMNVMNKVIMMVMVMVSMMNVMNKVIMMVMVTMTVMNKVRRVRRRITVIVTATYFSGETERGIVKIRWDH